MGEVYLGSVEKEDATAAAAPTAPAAAARELVRLAPNWRRGGSWRVWFRTGGAGGSWPGAGGAGAAGSELGDRARLVRSWGSWRVWLGTGGTGGARGAVCQAQGR